MNPAQTQLKVIDHRNNRLLRWTDGDEQVCGHDRLRTEPVWTGSFLPQHADSGIMSDCDPAAVEEPGPTGPPAGPARPPLAAKALSESYSRLRYQDTSLLIWQQQQLDLQTAPPSTYLTRSQSAWYSSYGNQAVLIRDRRGLQGSDGQSRICSIM